MNIALGRLPSDPAVLAKMPTMYGHPMQSLEPPPKLDQECDIWAPGMYGNDTYPDCTAASWLHMLRSFAGTQSLDLNPDTSCALPFYANCIGMPNVAPEQLQFTTGASMASVLQYQWRNGCIVFSNDPPYPSRPMMGDFFTNDPHDQRAQCLSMWVLGAVWWGVVLRQRDIDAFLANDVWDDDGTDSSPVVGGHAIAARKYSGLSDVDQTTVFTWGKRQPTTWRWVKRRMEESHSVLWRQLILLDSAAGVPLDYDRLTAACRSWSIP